MKQLQEMGFQWTLFRNKNTIPWATGFSCRTPSGWTVYQFVFHPFSSLHVQCTQAIVAPTNE
jgi:hypothetical protein